MEIDPETLRKMNNQMVSILAKSPAIDETAKAIGRIGAALVELFPPAFAAFSDFCRSINWHDFDQKRDRKAFYSHGKHLGFKHRWKRRGKRRG